MHELVSISIGFQDPTFINLLISGKMHILTEFCSGGSLRKLLIDSRVYSSPSYTNMVSTLNHNQLLKFAVDVANGMAHLSSQKVLVKI